MLHQEVQLLELRGHYGLTCLQFPEVNISDSVHPKI